jgi:hypothetical protein
VQRLQLELEMTGAEGNFGALPNLAKQELYEARARMVLAELATYRPYSAMSESTAGDLDSQEAWLLWHLLSSRSPSLRSSL